MLVACTAAVLVGVVRLDSWVALSMVPGAWSVSCADWRSFMLNIGVPSQCLLCSLAVPGVSLCNTRCSGSGNQSTAECKLFTFTFYSNSPRRCSSNHSSRRRSSSSSGIQRRHRCRRINKHHRIRSTTATTVAIPTTSSTATSPAVLCCSAPSKQPNSSA